MIKIILTFYKTTKNRLKILYNDKNRKPFFQILHELIYTAMKIRGIPSHYFSYFLYRRGERNFLDYLGRNEILKVHQSIHDKNKMLILDNKLFFQEFFEKTGIMIPTMLAFNFGNIFFLNNHRIEVNSMEYFFEILNNLLKESNSKTIFIKPIIGAFGENIHKITINNIINNEFREREELFNKICSGNFIFQETVIQHPDINEIYSESLNTIRIDTFINDDGAPEIISAAMRMGIDGSCTDNMSGGGFFVPINLETGCLRKTGLTYFKYGAKTFIRHPNSGISFENFKIPYFDELQEMVKAASNLLKERLVGWDIGISSGGPVLIEGNAYYGMAASQMSYGGYRKHPLFSGLIDSIKRN